MPLRLARLFAGYNILWLVDFEVYGFWLFKHSSRRQDMRLHVEIVPKNALKVLADVV